MARANPVWREAAGTEVLAVFQGPQAYITPSWYPSKAATAKVVPTWNYAVVHAHGPLRVDRRRAPGCARWSSRLTDTHEASRAQRWQVGDAPADYIEQMLRAIVGIEIEVTRLQGKWKVSQNRSGRDRRRRRCRPGQPASEQATREHGGAGAQPERSRASARSAWPRAPAR